jgi:hypothetical protein
VAGLVMGLQRAEFVCPVTGMATGPIGNQLVRQELNPCP